MRDGGVCTKSTERMRFIGFDVLEHRKSRSCKGKGAPGGENCSLQNQKKVIYSTVLGGTNWKSPVKIFPTKFRAVGSSVLGRIQMRVHRCAMSRAGLLLALWAEEYRVALLGFVTDRSDDPIRTQKGPRTPLLFSGSSPNALCQTGAPLSAPVRTILAA